MSNNFDKKFKCSIVKKKQVEDILERLKSVESVKYDYEIAQILDVSKSTVSYWRKKNVLPIKHIVKYTLPRSFSLYWIIKGEGFKYQITPEILDFFKKHSWKELINFVDCCEVMDEYGVSLDNMELAIELGSRIYFAKKMKELLELYFEVTKKIPPIEMFYYFVFFKYELASYILFEGK